MYLNTPLLHEGCGLRGFQDKALAKSILTAQNYNHITLNRTLISITYKSDIYITHTTCAYISVSDVRCLFSQALPPRSR